MSREDDNWQIVRQLEQANIASRPSSSTIVDGDWILRLTPGHPSRRLNSLTILSRLDDGNYHERLRGVLESFAANDRPVCIRWTPLMPFVVDAHLSQLGWSREVETLVMAAEIATVQSRINGTGKRFDGVVEQIDLPRWVGIYRELGGIQSRAGTQLQANFEQSAATLCCLVANSPEGTPLAVAVAAIDADLVGLFEIFTAPDARRRGCALALISAALECARQKGAKTTWLQVMPASSAALRLYQKIGYDTLYSYHHRKPPVSEDA